MKSCHDILDLLSAYLDRELPEPDVHEVGRHVDACARCRTEMKALLALKEQLRRQPMPTLPGDLRRQIKQGTLNRPSGWAHGTRRVWLSAMAGLATAAAGWLWMRHEASVPQTPGALMAAPAIPSSATIALHHAVEKDRTLQSH